MSHIKTRAKTTSTNVILALSELLKVREKKGIQDTALAAGLPDHEVPLPVRKALMESAAAATSPYVKYDPKAPIKETDLSPRLSEFHEKFFQTHFKPEEIQFSHGSTPVLQAVTSITNEPGKTTLLISPSYPLIELPIKREGGTINRTARLVNAADHDQNGRNFSGNRWQLDMHSLRESLEQNRAHSSLLYLNFPNNPTGFTPTAEEYQALAKLLVEDIQKRRTQNLPPLIILEDIAYAGMTHGRNYYSLHQAINALRQTHAHEPEIRNALDILDHSIVVAHSFSKSFAIAGDRVGYWAARNPELRAAIANYMSEFLLTPSRSGMAAMKGALEVGTPSPDTMAEYAHRLSYLEEGLNRVTQQWIERHFPRSKEQISPLLSRPVPAKADAGFFVTANMALLKGQPMVPTKIKELRTQIDAIAQSSGLPKHSIDEEFRDIFQNGTVNTALDASLWMLYHAHIMAIPLTPRNDQDPLLLTRWSVGKAPIPILEKTLATLENAFEKNLDPRIVAEQNQHYSSTNREKNAWQKKLQRPPALYTESTPFITSRL